MGVFSYISSLQEFKDNKWIIETHFIDLVSLHVGACFEQILIPHFEDTTSHSRILSILSPNSKANYIYLKEWFKIYKHKTKIQDDLKYLYLELLTSFDIKSINSFLTENHLKLDRDKCLSILKDLPLSKAFLWEKKGDPSKSINILMESLSLSNPVITQPLQFEAILEKIAYFCNEYPDLDTWHEFYLKSIDLFIQSKHDVAGKIQASLTQKIQEANKEIHEFKTEMILMDPKDPRFEIKKKMIERKQEQVNELSKPKVVVPREVHQSIQDRLAKELMAMQSSSVVMPLKLLCEIQEKYENDLLDTQEFVRGLVAMHRQELEWLRFGNKVLKKEMVNFQKEVFEKRAKMGHIITKEKSLEIHQK
jgi:hypothetical protein